MKIEQTQLNISNYIEHFLQIKTPNHNFSKIYKYALLPHGKLFRPLMSFSVYKDFSDEQKIPNDLYLLATALEIHHTYTLLHDDLPCMDNDDTRRGKLSTHKEFGEWQALLAADGLINLSYQALSEIKSNNLILILKLFSRQLGPKGLIQGQVLDLSKEMTNDIPTLIETHKLKTARLIQTALVSGLILSSNSKLDLNLIKSIYRLGESIGVFFQLLDDLTELVENNLKEHETSVNPWPRWPVEMSRELICHGEIILEKIDTFQLNNTRDVFLNYSKKILSIVEENSCALTENIQSLSKKNCENEILPVIAFLNRLSKL